MPRSSRPAPSFALAEEFTAAHARAFAPAIFGFLFPEFLVPDEREAIPGDPPADSTERQPCGQEQRAGGSAPSIDPSASVSADSAQAWRPGAEAGGSTVLPAVGSFPISETRKRGVRDSAPAPIAGTRSHSHRNEEAPDAAAPEAKDDTLHVVDARVASHQR